MVGGRMSLRGSGRWTRSGCLLALLLAPGCSELACPTNAGVALEITVENGVFQGACLYDVNVTSADGEPVRVDCFAGGSECSCLAGEVGGHYTVQFREQNSFLLAEQELEAKEGPCGVITEEVRYEGPPLDELPRPACLAANEHFESCGLGLDSDYAGCVVHGLRSHSIDEGAEDLGASFDCASDCVTSRDCEELTDQICAEGYLITVYERCIADCLGFSREETMTLASLPGTSARCADGAGGSGGAGD